MAKLKQHHFLRPIFDNSRVFPITFGLSIHSFVQHIEARHWIKTEVFPVNWRD